MNRKLRRMEKALGKAPRTSDQPRGGVAPTVNIAFSDPVQVPSSFLAGEGCHLTVSAPAISDALNSGIEEILSSPYACTPYEKQRVISALLLSEPIARGAAAVKAAWPTLLSESELLQSADWQRLARNTAFLWLLNNEVVTDIWLERYLSSLRRLILLRATSEAMKDGQEEAALLEVCCAIAINCHLAEYAFAVSDDEYAKVAELQESLATSLSCSEGIVPLKIAALAAYVPLTVFHDHQALLQEFSAPLRGVVEQQLVGPLTERDLARQIEALSGITDDTSMAVREQYEENPYPRWGKTARIEPYEDMYAVLRQRCPLADIDRFPSDRILVAGCGTGRHPIHTALRLPRAQVTAIDLSLASLAYGLRKARELEVENLKFAQADILNLSDAIGQYDIIECVGVLHHLENPLQGWLHLLKHLKPGGVMRIGLYSEYARKFVVAAREAIIKRRLKPTDRIIRQFRQDVVDNGLNQRFGMAFTRSADFYTLSSCRDLLFHIQEHRFTLPVIEKFLNENNLRFIGFDVDDHVKGSYQSMFGDDPACRNLRLWNRYEKKHPNTFAKMYQFWVQRPVS